MTNQRWNIQHYGPHYDNWSVYEASGGGRTEPFPSIVSWLTEAQAQAIADCLNDVAGHDWHMLHPDWWDAAKDAEANERK